MAEHEFSIIASGLDPNANDFEDRFFEAGCDDATIAFQKGWIVLDFTREAPSFSDALDSAVADVQRAGARVAHVEPDYLVSLSDIAKRLGLTRAALTNYAKGDRGDGFPAPRRRIMSESPLYDFAEVTDWFCERGQVTAEVVVQARVVRRINLSLQQAATEDSPRPKKQMS